MAESALEYWITEKRQLEVLASSRRYDIVDRVASGGPISIKELAEQIGARPSRLYHHMTKLLDVGLVHEAGYRIIQGRREQLYQTPAPQMRLGHALSAGQYPALIDNIVSSLSRQMAREFKMGATLPFKTAEGDERNFGFFRVVGRPSPRQLARINGHIAEIVEIFLDSSNEGQPFLSLAGVITPLGMSE